MKPTATPLPSAQATAPDGLDCERVNTILDQIIVGNDPSVEDEEYFISHAEDCSPCFDSIEKQHIFVDFLAQHVGRKGAPSSLPETIMNRLQAKMV
ncbi:hypothetical protein MUN82_20690 [Hymenobacter aerilatus]|uniref:Zinc-finger domain-containing protein n=1 Tax=Hymenobacter aerilatus TaxID=2932251 RepID=A0A8T9SU09_9BACT|nr:hypothetical protein [Hymenobacter aerilatus]UOR05335.1 hypothetical protein MUN82_20690 [Hymenobacter aerilatus]